MVLTSTGGGTGGLAITAPEATNTNAKARIPIFFIITSPSQRKLKLMVLISVSIFYPLSSLSIPRITSLMVLAV
jgi:hypothetical protein